MSKKVGAVDDSGKVVTWKARRVRQVELPVTVVDTRLKRFIRKAVG